jgi:molybdopterin converting factor small subunit
MKEQDVAYISEQFGIEKEIVEASVNDGTLGVRLQDSLSAKKIYSNEDFSKLLTNHEVEVKNNYFTELIEKAKKGDIPNELHKPIKGATLQQLERDLSKKYNINEFNDLTDLVERAVKTKSANGSTPIEIESQISELKQANLRLVEEKENAVKTVESQYKQRFIDKEKVSALDVIPLDFSDIKTDDIDKARAKTKTLIKSVFDAEYQLDYDEQNRLVVKDREGKTLKNDATRDPLPVDDVMTRLAIEYGFKIKSPEKGGQGGKSSNNESGVFANMDAYAEWCAQKGIAQTSKEALEMYRKSGLNKT